jgi:hypothetical protein
MRRTLGLLALIGTLATTALSGTASAHERRVHDRSCHYGRWLEQEHHERREREVREHHERRGWERGRQVGQWW